MSRILQRACEAGGISNERIFHRADFGGRGKFCRQLRGLVVAILLTTLFSGTSITVPAQTNDFAGSSNSATNATRLQQDQSLSRYVDQANGMTVDEAVAYALAHNGELLAARKE